MAAASAFNSLGEAAHKYLARRKLATELEAAAMAVAGVVVGNHVQMTNSPWCASVEDLLAQLALKQLYVPNDFEAVSRSLPAVRADELMSIGSPAPLAEWEAGTRVAVVGSGTGLGTGALVVTAAGPVILPSEAGHSAFAPSDEVEEAILTTLRKRYRRVSYERLLCAEGLANIHHALAVIEGRDVEPLTPAEITQRASQLGDPQSLGTLYRFCGILGAYAGDVALQFCAGGGVYLGGGVLPRIADFLRRSRFRERFEDKGRLASYNAAIPTSVLMYEQPGLLGAARFLHEVRCG